jgi:serine/threonine protein kinase
MFHAGQQIGVYVLIERLGKGGFGEVWLAEKRSGVLTKKVAIKLPHEESVNLEAIKQEAALWEQVSKHENVLTIFDADIYDGQVAIISEYAEGGSLADKLKAEGKLAVEQAVEMTIGILKGLHHLHSKYIIHRDIKPQNILLQGNTPRLADFGISRAMNTLNISSVVIGTDSYMAPEALDGARNVQTDIWSVGVVLYQLLKGNLPFPQEHYSERMFAILTKDFEPLSEEIPQNLREIVKQALAKKPEERFQTAEEMHKALDMVLTYLRNPTFAPTQIFPKAAQPSPPVENNPSVLTQIPAIPPISYELPPTQASPPINKNPQDEIINEDKAGENKSPVSNETTSFYIPPQPPPSQNKIWFISAPIVLVIVVMLIYSASKPNSNPANNSNNASSFTSSPITSKTSQPVYSPTPTPNYDIPDIKANAELKFYESGNGGLPQAQRKYATIFDKSATRYVYYELNLDYPAPGVKRYFTMEQIWYKDNTVIYNESLDSFIEESSVSSTFTDGYGNALYGNLGAGKYKLEIKYNGFVVVSNNFEVQLSLAGNWEGSTWGTVTISGSGSSYTGTYTTPSSTGTFSLSKSADGTYRGTWKSSTYNHGGAIEKAVVSSDGNTLNVTWGYSYPDSMKSTGQSSKWTRKKS